VHIQELDVRLLAQHQFYLSQMGAVKPDHLLVVTAVRLLAAPDQHLVL
jgi:hypothetical protein